MSVRAGAAAPEAIRIDVTGPVGIDMQTVTAAEATIYHPDGTTSEWTFTLGAATATTRTLTRVFSADALDVPKGGARKCALRLSFGAVVRRPDVFVIPVQEYP